MYSGADEELDEVYEKIRALGYPGKEKVTREEINTQFRYEDPYDHKVKWKRGWYSRKIERKIKKLVEAGLLKRAGRGVYILPEPLNLQYEHFNYFRNIAKQYTKSKLFQLYGDCGVTGAYFPWRRYYGNHTVYGLSEYSTLPPYEREEVLVALDLVDFGYTLLGGIARMDAFCKILNKNVKSAYVTACLLECYLFLAIHRAVGDHLVFGNNQKLLWDLRNIAVNLISDIYKKLSPTKSRNEIIEEVAKEFSAFDELYEESPLNRIREKEWKVERKVPRMRKIPKPNDIAVLTTDSMKESAIYSENVDIELKEFALRFRDYKDFSFNEKVAEIVNRGIQLLTSRDRKTRVLRRDEKERILNSAELSQYYGKENINLIFQLIEKGAEEKRRSPPMSEWWMNAWYGYYWARKQIDQQLSASHKIKSQNN